ncbi:hypothetical protein A6R70_22450 [Agrobacterium rubi]|nr:hypothetical protein [Agrobacterium rubi]
MASVSVSAEGAGALSSAGVDETGDSSPVVGADAMGCSCSSLEDSTGDAAGAGEDVVSPVVGWLSAGCVSLAVGCEGDGE